MNPLLSVSGVHAGYSRREVVRGVSFSVEPGEFCALLGLNGCGKTTLLKSICGLMPMLQGSCTVSNQDCTRMHERERSRLLSYIPQRGSLIMGKTVLEVVLMGFNPHLGLLDSPGEAQKKEALHTLGRLGLEDFAQRDYGALSEGQKQLVILARALVQNAPVMLMDEPDSALDFVNRNMVLGKIRGIIHEENRAGLITLHDPNFALSYCDRLLLMRDGVIACELRMAGAGVQQVEDALSLIYGEIRILQHPGGFAMVHI